MRQLPRRVWIGSGLLLVPAVVAAAAAAEPPEVPVFRPVSRLVTDYVEYTGRVVPSAQVEVRARADGPIVAVHFRAGDNVKLNDLLFTVDPRPFQAEADRAAAVLRGAEARAKAAASELSRSKRLHDNGTAPKEEFEQATARHEEALAGVEAARASLEHARFELDSTRVMAPMSGKIGRPLLDPGNFVKAGVTPLATIVATQPALADFDVDERTFLDLRKEVRAGKLGVRRVEDFSVSLQLPGEEGFPHRGKVESVSNHVDPATGVIQFRAAFPNPDGDLVPGAFARVRLPTGAPLETLLIPEGALRHIGTELPKVYVVNDKNVVEGRTVSTGALQDDGYRVVKSGITATDRVIGGDAKGVRPGQEVKPRLVHALEKGKP
jgi:multidrug efflux system membrane fusion protein